MMTAAIVLGVVVCALAYVFSGVGRGDDPATRWEGSAAVGFLFAIVGGPFWIAQGVCSLIATLDGGSLWLWAWFFGAPVLGNAVRQALPRSGEDAPAIARRRLGRRRR